MNSLCFAYVLTFSVPQQSQIQEFGAQAAYHHDHKVDTVFVNTKLMQQKVHFSCKETKHNFVAKFPRMLKYCRATWLEQTKNRIEYSGHGIDVNGVVCNFRLKVLGQGKAGKLLASSVKTKFSDNLANDPRFKDSEWRVKGEVIGFGPNDEGRTILIMSTGRIIDFNGPGHAPIKTDTLPAPVPQSLILKAKGRFVEIYDRKAPIKPIYVLDEFFHLKTP